MLSLLHFGFVTKYLSDSIVSGLSVGAVYHIITSQVKLLLGINHKPTELPFVLVGVTILFKYIIIKLILKYNFNLFRTILKYFGK